MDGSEDFVRFERETAGIYEPADDPTPGEVIPPGETPEDEGFDFPVDDFLTDDVVALIFSMPGTAMARKTGHDWWQPDENERQLLGKTIGPAARSLANKFLSGAAGPVAMMGVGLGIVYGPRAIREVQERRAERSSPKAPYSTQQPTASAASSVNVDAASPSSSGDFGTPYDEL